MNSKLTHHAAILIVMLSSPCLYASNSIITSTYTADPSPHQWSDGKYYMYCSHDQNADTAR